MSQKGQTARSKENVLRRHYWSPRREGIRFVDEESFLYPFCMTMESGFWSDLHSHEDFGEIFYASSGCSVLCVEQGNLACDSRRAIWIPPGVAHEWYTASEIHNRAVFVHSSAVAGRERFNSLHMIEVTPLLRAVIASVAEDTPDFSSDKGRRLGQVLLDSFEDAPLASSSLVMPRTHQLVEMCARAMLAPEEPISFDDWSEKLHMSSKTLARMFSRETGQTMGQWVQLMRLLHARQCIDRGQSITEAALESGYSSVSAFIHAFRKRFGVTPGSSR